MSLMDDMAKSAIKEVAEAILERTAIPEMCQPECPPITFSIGEIVALRTEVSSLRKLGMLAMGPAVYTKLLVSALDKLNGALESTIESGAIPEMSQEDLESASKLFSKLKHE